MRHQDSPLTELSALVGVFALVTSVLYSGDAYDLWDALIGIVSGVFGALFLRSLATTQRDWHPTHIALAGFLVAALVVGGLATFLLGISGFSGAEWEEYGPFIIVSAGLPTSGWLYWRSARP